MSFKLVFFENRQPEHYGSKPHFIPDSLFDDAVAELCTRFNDAVANVKDTVEGLVDLPGMIRMDRTYQEFDLGGFKLSLPTTDIMHYFRELKDGKLRSVNGKQYYKLHGWIHCIMITPEMRNAMLAQIEGNLEAIDRKMLEEQRAFDRSIEEINKNGVKILTPKREQKVPPFDKNMN